MISELSTILITSISTLSTTGGVFTILYYRQNKKLKELEVSKASIEAKRDEWHIYKEQLESANEQIKALGARNTELLNSNFERYNQMKNREMEITAERNAMLERHNNQLNAVEERFNNQTNILRATNRKLTEALERINQLTIEKGKMLRLIDHLKQWLCVKPWKMCKLRQPEQKVKPEKYIPLEELDRETEELIREVTELASEGNIEKEPQETAQTK